mgnify:FL=1
MDSELLFTPIKIGNLELKNRIMRSATCERIATDNGCPTEKLNTVLEDLAIGGVGLIVTGYTYISETGRSNSAQMGIYTDDYIPVFKKLSSDVHKCGAKIAIQLVHSGRQTRSKHIGGKTPMAPSAVEEKSSKVIPHELSNDEIEKIIAEFGDAAKRVQIAEFDAVQLHGAHGYLISQFISPYTNCREDKWGGNSENRMRFLIEVYRNVRTKVGDDFPIMIKLNGADFIKGGLGLYITDAVEIAKTLAKEGINMIEVSASMWESYFPIVKPDIDSPEKEAYFLSLAEEIKKAIPNIPVATVGGIRSREIMEKIISDGKADIISLCRPLICETDLPLKLQRGQLKSECISCNKCLNPRVAPIYCVQKRKNRLNT